MMKSFTILVSVWLLLESSGVVAQYAVNSAQEAGILIEDVQGLVDHGSAATMGKDTAENLIGAFPVASTTNASTATTTGIATSVDISETIEVVQGSSNQQVYAAAATTAAATTTAAADTTTADTTTTTNQAPANTGTTTINIPSTTTVGGLVPKTTTLAEPEQDTPSCPLQCENQGVCSVGELNYDRNPHVLAAFGYQPVEYHCECPAGWAGLLCDKPYISCNDGNHACFHSGECLPSFLDESGGTDQYYCDCSNAVMSGKLYAGKFCQSEAVDVCQSGQDPIYCVNGACKSHFLVTPTHPCTCEEGFVGPHCEYKAGEAPNCDLDCNSGTCRVGKVEYSRERSVFVPTVDDHQYCICQQGSYGPQCEFKGEKCGVEHCYNGGSCVERLEPNGSIASFCDCSTAVTERVSYGGEFCEAESSAFCTRLPDHNGQQFCVNGGACKGES